MREHEEKELYGETRRAQRKERKLASKHDRSKHKFTDQKQRKSEQKEALLDSSDVENLEKGILENGKVLLIRSKDVLVRLHDKEIICTLRGTLKQDKEHKKNLLVVGDNVLVQRGSENQGTICTVLPRKSLLSRQDNLDRIREQLIAANVDKLFITTSVIAPILRATVIDRYLIAAERGNLIPILIINKIDLLHQASEEEQEHYQAIVDLYRSLGILVIPTSIETKEGLDQIQNQLQNSVSVFSGQSGTGKSSIINLLTGLDLRTAPTVIKTKKGAHTTTYAQLLELPFGGFCVDTPGIKSFGLWGLEPKEVTQYFPEILEHACNCTFRDCTHRGEEGCAIPDAIEQDLISPERFLSYCSLRQSLEDEHLRR